MTELPSIRKFMFDREFDDPAKAKSRDQKSKHVTLTLDQLEAVKKEAHEAGLAAGRKIGGDELTRHLETLLTHLRGQIDKLVSEADAVRKDQERALREATLAIARKVLPDFVERHGLAEIQAIVSSIVAQMTNEPRLVVRIHEKQFDALNASFKDLIEKQGFTGKLVVLADAQVEANNCLIEWADGGIERNTEALLQFIGNSVAPGSKQPAVPETDAIKEAGNG